MLRDLIEAGKISIIIGSVAIWGNALLQSLGLPDSALLEAATIFVLSYVAGYFLLGMDRQDRSASSILLMSSLAIAMITGLGNASTDAAGVPNSLFAEWIIAICTCTLVLMVTMRMRAKSVDD